MKNQTVRWLAVVGGLLVSLATGLGVAVSGVSGRSPDPGQNQGWAFVDCGKERQGALQRAVDRSQPGDTIRVAGTCTENVNVPVDKDSITLDGGGTAVINGPDPALNTINVRGTRWVVITGFTITGGRTGISIDRGASAFVDGNTVEHTGRIGIIVGGWSTANLVNNTVQDNPSHGIQVTGNAYAFVGFATADDTVASPNVVRNNGMNGVNVTFSASARIVGNTITGNARSGINVDRASQANVSDNIIDANSQNGILVTENSGVNLGSDTGTGIFDAPNRTLVNNVLRGISCRVGAYVNGRIGTLNGAAGQKEIFPSCVDALDKPDNL